MAEDRNHNNASPPASARRSSFAGETFANLFGAHRGSISRSPSEAQPNGPQNGAYPNGQQYNGPITSAAAQAQRRRLSLTTLGLSASPNQSSPFGSYHSRRDSYGTAGSDSIDESAIEDDPAMGPNPTPNTPFARRMSFGAKALRDVRTGGGGSGSPQNGTSKPSTIAENDAPRAPNGTISNRDTKARASEGFNWSENLRTRAERTSSIGGVGIGSLGHNSAGGSPPARHDRAQSVAVMEPPAREMPKPKEQVRPDHFQERILKGDFYMD